MSILTPHLLVPMTVDVLVLREDGGEVLLDSDFAQALDSAPVTGPSATGPAAAAGWEVFNGPQQDATSDSHHMAAHDDQPTRLDVTTAAAGSGLRQAFRRVGFGPDLAVTSVTVQVRRGRLGIGTGDGDHTRVDTWVDAGSGESQLRTLNASRPANRVTLTALSDDGADFTVTRVTVQAVESGQLLRNPGFDAAAVGGPDSTTLTGTDGEGTAAADAWTVRHQGEAADAVTTTAREPTTRPGARGSMLAVTSTSPGSSLVQQFLTADTGPAGAEAEFWLQVTRGTVALSCGQAGVGTLGPDIQAGDWTGLRLPSSSVPVNEVAVSVTSADGADFCVDAATVTPTDGGQLLSNATFDVAGEGPTRLEGAPAGGAAAAADWLTWNNASSVTTTELRPSSRRPDGQMLHVSTTAAGCGVVQTFLPVHTGPGNVIAEAWVRVARGTVTLGTGDGGNTGSDATSRRTGEWELLSAGNGVSPANEFIVYASSPGGADYDLDTARVRGGQAVTPWAQCRMSAPDPAGPVLQQLLPAPFATRAARGPGAYLHWALPDALTHTEQGTAADGAASPPQFPAIPQRWLVARLAVGNGGRRAVKAWVLDSAASPAAPVVTPLDAWTAPDPGTPPTQPLTALGHGDPSWAAFYDNVEGTLGFFDPLQDAEGPLAYLVCGWYVHPELDPLTATSPATATALLDLLADWRWDLPGEEVPAAPLPASLLVHGSAVGIAFPERGWPGDADGVLSREEDQRPDPDAVRLAFAETINHALTALATSPEEPAQTRTVIEAFLAQATAEDTGPDGPQRLAAALHATRFSASSPDAYQETIWQAADPHPVDAPEIQPHDTAGTAAADGQFTGVARSAPRRYSPGEPTVVLQGAGRSFKHGGDGRFQPDQRLLCRLPDRTLTTLGPAADGTGGSSAQALLGGVQHDAVPPECQRLLAELAALDPGSVAPPQSVEPSGTTPVVPPSLARTRWWASWDPANGDVDIDADGDLPSPLALTPPSRPWNPLRLDWQVRYATSPNGIRDWTLSDNDLAPRQLPAALTGTPISGHTLLTPGPAAVVAGASAAATRAADGTSTPLGDVAYADLIGGDLDGLLAAVRGDDPGQRVGDDPAPVNTDPTPVRAGVLSLHRLRVVDTFGQVIDLLDDTDGHGVDPGKVLVPPEIAAPDQPAALVLPPRFTGPARVLLRYTSADGAVDQLERAVEADDAVSPVCGYLMADHVDGSIEVFDSAGTAQGRLRPDPVTGTAWEAPPGMDSGYGERPRRRLANSTLAAIVENLLDADAAAARAGGGEPNALALVLRLIDAMRSTIDLTANAGDEHRALILGNPIAVMRAELELEVTDTGSPTTPVEVRLGSLDRLEDGLLAYYVDGDHSRLHLVEPELAQAAGLLDDMEPNPYFDHRPLIVAPGHRVSLTLLMQPECDVHVTTGLLPQKAVGMRHSWASTALAQLTPSLRYGPVLVPEGQVRLPLPTDVSGTWTWIRRERPDTWALDQATPGVGDTALTEQPAHLADGWLRLALIDTSWDQFGVPVPVTSINKPYRDQAEQPLLGVGGINAAGRSWLLRTDQVIDLIRSGRYIFSMQPTSNGNPAGHTLGGPLPLRIATGPDGADTLTTATAQDQVDRLPTLPESGIGIRIWDPANLSTKQPDDDYRRYFLTARHSGLALDVYGPSVIHDGAAVQQFGLHGGANQQWQFAWTDSSYFHITAWVSGKCLQVARGDLTDGAAVDQAGYTGAASQQWQAVATGDGYVILYARHSGKCLTVAGGPEAMGNETRCVQANYSGLTNQHWKLGDVPLTPSLDATVLALSLPGTMWTWQGDRVRATVRNTGNTTWTAAVQHSLLPVDGLRGLRLPLRAQLTVPGDVSPGKTVTFDALIAAGSQTAQLTGSMAMGLPGTWPPENDQPPAPRMFGRTSDPVTLTVAPVTPTQLSGTEAAIVADPQAVVLYADEHQSLAVRARNNGSITWYPELGFAVVPTPTSPAKITALHGEITAPVPPGGTAGGHLETWSDHAGVYPVTVHVIQPRDTVADVSPAGIPVNITVCGLQSVTNIDGSKLPDKLQEDTYLTMRINLNVPAPRDGLNVSVFRDNALVETLPARQNATYVEHRLYSDDLSRGVHSYRITIGADSFQTQITIIKHKESKELKDKELLGAKEKDLLAPKETDKGIDPPRTPSPGETETTGSATPWIGTDERPDLGGPLYSGDEE